VIEDAPPSQFTDRLERVQEGCSSKCKKPFKKDRHQERNLLDAQAQKERWYITTMSLNGMSMKNERIWRECNAHL
jgi:hypothetical protein